MRAQVPKELGSNGSMEVGEGWCGPGMGVSGAGSVEGAHRGRGLTLPLPGPVSQAKQERCPLQRRVGFFAWVCPDGGGSGSCSLSPTLPTSLRDPHNMLPLPPCLLLNLQGGVQGLAKQASPQGFFS